MKPILTILSLVCLFSSPAFAKNIKTVEIHSVSMSGPIQGDFVNLSGFDKDGLSRLKITFITDKEKRSNKIEILDYSASRLELFKDMDLVVPDQTIEQEIGREMLQFMLANLARLDKSSSDPYGVSKGQKIVTACPVKINYIPTDDGLLRLGRATIDYGAKVQPGKIVSIEVPSCSFDRQN